MVWVSLGLLSIWIDEYLNVLCVCFGQWIFNEESSEEYRNQVDRNTLIWEYISRNNLNENAKYDCMEEIE